LKTIESYPLTWPEGWKRTVPLEIRRNWPFHRGSLGKHRDSLEDEVRKLGGINLIISTNMKVRKDGGIIVGQAEPRDAGVAAYFTYNEKPMCFACDQFETVRENIRAIALTIESIRAIERYGASDMMERAFKGFTAIPEKAGEYWRDVLQFPPEQKVTAADIETAFKRLAHVAHPDKGGDVEQWHLLNNARQNALRDIGAQR